ncbi:MAG: anti-sigma factor [Dermatophilaceae bacterium]
MTHMTDDRLVDIALGSAADATETAHLSGCAECTAVLDGVTDTISLTQSTDSTVLVAPPARVWEAIQAEIRTQAAPDLISERHGGSGFRDESFGDVTAPPEPSGTVTSLSGRHRHGRRPAFPATWLLAAACVLGIVLGVGGATVAGRMGTEPEPSETTVATVDLTPLDSPDTQGRAVLVDRTDGLDLSVSAAGLDPGEGYLEVWLINRDLSRMISVGVLPSDATEIVLPVSQDLIDQGYVIVDISREGFDDQPAHSGDTVVRGELPV